jgi:ABC-type Fe3+/spermidine/putrescine transport system ATPase subunit
MKQNLRVQGIEKEYEDQPLLCGISFELAAGETLCLLGSSGSGKSTLLRIIAGIESADAGQVFWNGEDLSDVPTHLRHFGLMFQDYALFPHLNVADNIAFGLRMQNTQPAEIRQRVKDALEQVNLVGFEKRNVSELSGGEKQRVALARALAPSPRLLMLDEPLAALDRALRQQLQEELRNLLHQTNIPTIYVTHDQEEALALGDRLALLHEGQIVQMGAPEEVYRMPRNRWVAEFLGMENLLPARVSQSQPLTVTTAFGDLAATASAGLKLQKGDEVQIVLLPTGVTIAEENSGENLLPITVTESTFRGEHYLLKGKTNAGEELVFFTPTGATIGTKLNLSFSRTNVVCLHP